MSLPKVVRTVYSCRAPLRDIRCVVHDVLVFEERYRSYGRDDLNRDLLQGLLEQGARRPHPRGRPGRGNSQLGILPLHE